MLRQFCNYRFYLILLTDIAIFLIAFIGAYLLRFDFTLDPTYRHQIWRLLPFLLPCKVFLFLMRGLYRGMWRYTSLNDLLRLGQASLLGMVVYITATLYIHGFQGVPRSIFVLDAILTFLMSGGLRVGIRLRYAYNSAEPENPGPFRFPGFKLLRPNGKNILLVGAGAAGEKMLREILDNPRLDYHPVGFLDDDRNKWGLCLHGFGVFGGVDLLPRLLERSKIDEVLIAIPSATGPQMRRISELCESCKVPYRTLPEIGAIIDGKVSIKNLRDVKFEDLLRRPPVQLVTEEISQYLQGKKVLITGAGGSIGSELCRQIIPFHPQELILVDASEPHLFDIQMELQHDLRFNRYRCLLSRVQNQTLMKKIFANFRPQVVFHAAAYKHVPLLENNPWKAIANNVVGSKVVMDLSQKYGVERFVLVSTDKAVRPTNVMGASKRLAELLLQSSNGNGTRFMAVRFGNVIGSSGSVLPLFRRQLERGGPITVTHPEVTRYFMTIPEAAQLILQAGGLGQGGEIFILEMGTPVKIAEMAKALVRLSGKEPDKDVEIIFTGLREGEKLYEELISLGEDIMDTRYDKIKVLCPIGWNGHKNRKEFIKWLHGALEELFHVANINDAPGIRRKLKEILPEYQPQNGTSSIFEPKYSLYPVSPPAMQMDPDNLPTEKKIALA